MYLCHEDFFFLPGLIHGEVCNHIVMYQDYFPRIQYIQIYFGRRFPSDVICPQPTLITTMCHKNSTDEFVANCLGTTNCFYNLTNSQCSLSVSEQYTEYAVMYLP